MRRLFPLLLLGVLSCSSRKIADDYDGGAVGKFSLTERGGRTVTQDDLLGKVWIASFIFTRCTSGCPQITATVQRLQRELELSRKPDLRLVSFTVDPRRDNQDELRQYAEHFKADPDRWLFLTGKPQEAIHELLTKGFKVPVAEKQEEKKKPGDEFDHSTRLVLIDRRGHIRGYYQGMPLTPSDEDEKGFEANLAKLRQHVGALLAEKP